MHTYFTDKVRPDYNQMWIYFENYKLVNNILQFIQVLRCHFTFCDDKCDLFINA